MKLLSAFVAVLLVAAPFATGEEGKPTLQENNGRVLGEVSRAFQVPKDVEPTAAKKKKGKGPQERRRKQRALRGSKRADY